MAQLSRNTSARAKTPPIRRRRTLAANEKKNLSEDEFMASAIGDVEWLRQSLRDGRGEIHYDRNGLAPIHLSAVHGRLDCLKLLIEKFKVDVNLASTTGWRPIHLAISNQTGKRSFLCLIYLLEQGADPSVTNEDGVTPVHQAASEGHVQCLKLLVELGAKIDCEDCRGHTPLDLAKLWGHRKAARILAMEKWHKDKEFLVHELKQLDKVKMQQVLMEIESDEANHVDQQFYGQLAFNDWLRKRGLENKSADTVPREKSAGSNKDKKSKPTSKEKARKEEAVYRRDIVSQAKETLHRANSYQQSPVGMTVTKPQPGREKKQVEQLGSKEKKDVEQQRRVQIVQKPGTEGDSLSIKSPRSHTPMTKTSEESAGLHERPEELVSTEYSEVSPDAQSSAQQRLFYNTNRWNKSTKLKEKDYVTILRDTYPRDEYTKMPVKPMTAPPGVRRSHLLQPEEIEDIRKAKIDTKTKLRMPKLPKEVIDEALLPDGAGGKKVRPVVYKSKTILDIETKRKLELSKKPKTEVVLHISDALDSPLFQLNLQPMRRILSKSAGSSSSTASGSSWPASSFPREEVAYDLRHFVKPSQFPNIQGPEYDLNLGKYAVNFA